MRHFPSHVRHSLLLLATVASLIVQAVVGCGLETRTYNNPVDPNCKDADQSTSGAAPLQCPSSLAGTSTATASYDSSGSVSGQSPAGAALPTPTPYPTPAPYPTPYPTPTPTPTPAPTTRDSTIPKVASNPSEGDTKEAVQALLGKPDSVSGGTITSYWTYAALAANSNGCDLEFDSGLLESFAVACLPTKINYGTFGGVSLTAGVIEAGITISSGISKDAVRSKWGTPDEVDLAGQEPDGETPQTWTYKAESTNTGIGCELSFAADGTLTSFSTQCKTTDIDVATF